MSFLLDPTELSARRAPIHDARHEIPWAQTRSMRVAALKMRHIETQQYAIALVDFECHAYAFDHWFDEHSTAWDALRAAPHHVASYLLQGPNTGGDVAVTISRADAKLRTEAWIEL